VIGQGQEIERKPAMALLAAFLPQVEVTPFSLQSMAWETTLGDPIVFGQALAVPGTPKLFVMMADPFTTPMDGVLAAFNHFYADIPVVGGMASGSTRVGGNALLLDDRVLTHGAVGIALSGAVGIDVVISQGCRPIGNPLTVTAAQDNIILGLAGTIPLAFLQELLEELSAEDQRLLQNGLFIGRAINPESETLGRGDFLIRGVMGIDQESGAIVIGDHVQPGETVQFHVRDANTAREDLEMMLAPQLFFDPPRGGLLFSCNGRGIRLYDHPNGDITTIQNVVGSIDLAGFFCAGEIGPIGGKNFLHGHTASLALFRPQQVEH
jgi:small ligand-binding sensory domain FIST